jgi:hypothetical protein
MARAFPPHRGNRSDRRLTMTWRRTIPARSLALALALAAGLALVGLPGSPARADAGWQGDERGRDHHPSPITIQARQKYFGAENVDARDGRIRDDKVIFSWITNASVAVSVLGHLVFLDIYINRLELPPAPGDSDLRRTPINYQDLVSLKPEAIFLGHGHGDHADNAAYVAKWLDIPIYASPETCDVMQADVQRMFNDPNAVNGGAKIIPNGDPVRCIGIVSRGSVPGAEVVHLDALEPKVCIVAFKHIHSGSVPPDPTFPAVPVQNIPDPREPDLYPGQTCVTPLSNCQRPAGTPVPTTPLPGQVNLTTSGFGTLPGSPGGPISLFYQFIVRRGPNFSFVWHNTTGPLKEGAGSDPGLPSPAIGAHLFQIMESLPQTSIEMGSIVSLGFATNGVRDAILYQQHLRPLIYVPLHMTDVAVPSSSLEFKKSYLETLDTAQIPSRPEIRWMVDPNDFLRPVVYDPDDARWDSGRNNSRRIEEFCDGHGHGH